MVSETGDVQAFLAQHPPFNHLSDSQLEFAGDNTFVAFGKSGTEVNLNASTASNHTGSNSQIGMLVVRSGSMEIRTDQGELVDRLSSGDYIVAAGLSTEENKTSRIIILEDSLYYELSDYAFHSLSLSSSDIAVLLETDELRASFSPVDTANPSESPLVQFSNDSYLSQPVREVMSAQVICVVPQTSIRQAAQMMRQHRISSLLIQSDNCLIGILTDRDLRSRVLAEGVSDTKTVEKVMTPSPMCIDISSRLHDAHLKMMSAGVHHLPIVDNRDPVGIITLSDILQANNAEPLTLIHAINRADDVEELEVVAAKLPELVVKLIERDARAIEVGKIITSFSDGFTRRLIRLAEQKLGIPPCEYAWLAFGSQARQEQVLGSDQDNALLFPDDVKVDEAYFKALAEFVNDGLDKCGMPFCPGNIMAKNENWRLNLTGWKKHFTDWIEQPSPKALMHSSIFFDMRHIEGSEELTRKLRKYVLKLAKRNTIFLAMMCDNALLHSPPLGFFKTFVLESDGDHNHTLNLKKRGTIPIVDIARNYALSAKQKKLNTIERLQALEQAGEMSKEMSYSLIDAHEFIAGIRLEAQAKQYRASIRVDNYLDPKELSPLLRHQLKDAFHVVRDAQTAMRARFGGGVL